MLKILKYAWNAIVIIIWYFLYLSNASGPLVRIQKCLAFGWNSQCKLQQWFKIKILKSYNIILHCLFNKDSNSLPCYIVQTSTPCHVTLCRLQLPAMLHSAEYNSELGIILCVLHSADLFSLPYCVVQNKTPWHVTKCRCKLPVMLYSADMHSLPCYTLHSAE